MTFTFSCNKSSILVYILIRVASQKSMTEYWSLCFGGKRLCCDACCEWPPRWRWWWRQSLNGWMARVYEVLMLPIKCCKYITFIFSCNKSSILVYIFTWVALQKSMIEYWSLCFVGKRLCCDACCEWPLRWRWWWRQSLNGWMARVFEVPMQPIKCCKYITFIFSCNKSSILVYIFIWVDLQKSMIEYWSLCFFGKETLLWRLLWMTSAVKMTMETKP